MLKKKDLQHSFRSFLGLTGQSGLKGDKGIKGTTGSCGKNGLQGRAGLLGKTKFINQSNERPKTTERLCDSQPVACLFSFSCVLLVFWF